MAPLPAIQAEHVWVIEESPLQENDCGGGNGGGGNGDSDGEGGGDGGGEGDGEGGEGGGLGGQSDARAGGEGGPTHTAVPEMRPEKVTSGEPLVRSQQAG